MDWAVAGLVKYQVRMGWQRHRERLAHAPQLDARAANVAEHLRLEVLAERTSDRETRGVEGTHNL